MASYDKIFDEVEKLAIFIEKTVDIVNSKSSKMQGEITKMLQRQALMFEISDGRFVSDQDFTSRLGIIERNIERILRGNGYSEMVKDFLEDLNNIQERTIDLHVKYSDLEVKLSDLNPSRKAIHDRALASLNNGIAEQYIEPIKKLLAQNVMTGQSVSKNETALRNFGNGEYSSGRLNTATPTPSLDRYATQIARDTASSINRVTNGIIADKFDLKRFLYVGGKVKDSRPLCKHLVDLKRPINLSEMPKLIELYPQGLYPDTNTTNFIDVCGGYNCMHTAHVIA